MMEKNALIIGCGNIGALYDFENDNVATHAKALFLSRMFNLFFYDKDPVVAKKVADKYNGYSVAEITDELLQSCRWISVCSPTPTHNFYLEKLLKLENKFILCEKPVSYNLQELENISSLFQHTSSVIFVNYIRRFQKSYINFKYRFKELLRLESLSECTVEYCRGFINNGSHAFDLLEFLLDESLNLENIRISQKEYDVFMEDPTVSMTAEWGNSRIILKGHVRFNSPIFRIKLVFKSFSVEFLDSGNEIFVWNGTDSTPPFHKKDCLRNYMADVVGGFTKTSHGKEKSNFLTSINLNKKLLGYIN